jgi:hypothetical protein
MTGETTDGWLMGRHLPISAAAMFLLHGVETAS